MAILYQVMLLKLNEEINFYEEDLLMNDENHHKMLQLTRYHSSTIILMKLKLEVKCFVLSGSAVGFSHNHEFLYSKEHIGLFRRDTLVSSVLKSLLSSCVLQNEFRK